jgi:hypothetical protein
MHRDVSNATKLRKAPIVSTFGDKLFPVRSQKRSQFVACERGYYIVAKVVEVDDRFARECSVSRDELSDPFVTEAMFCVPCGLDQPVCKTLHLCDRVVDVVVLQYPRVAIIVLTIRRLPSLAVWFACVFIRSFQLLPLSFILLLCSLPSFPRRLRFAARFDGYCDFLTKKIPSNQRYRS